MCCSMSRSCCQPVAVLWSSWSLIVKCWGHAGDLLQRCVQADDLLLNVEVTLATCCSAVFKLMTCFSMSRSRWRPVAVLCSSLLLNVEVMLATCCSAVVKLMTCCSLSRSRWRPVAVLRSSWWCVVACRVTLTTCFKAVVKLAMCHSMSRSRRRPVAMLWLNWWSIGACGDQAGDLYQCCRCTGVL